MHINVHDTAPSSFTAPVTMEYEFVAPECPASEPKDRGTDLHQVQV